MHQSLFVKKTDRGEVLPLFQLEQKNKDSLLAVIAVIDAQKKNWAKFYNQAVEFHLKNAQSWGNASSGKDLSKQIDPDFVFPAE